MSEQLTHDQIEACREVLWLQDVPEELADMAQRCLQYERHCVLREHWMPEWAHAWSRNTGGQCFWLGITGAMAHVEDAPNICPDEDVPITLAIVP